MNFKLHNKIIKINNAFYTSIAADFSKSRSYPWRGWFRLFDYIKYSNMGKLSVLDLGCGNARFFKFLYKSTQMVPITYHGIDNCKPLLGFAKIEINNLLNADVNNTDFKVKLINKNVLNTKLFPKFKFNLVVAFGITHHIFDSAFRFKWFSSIINLVDIGGYLVLTFWNPNTSKLLKNSFEGFEDGDYLMGWSKTENKRYVHVYTKAEMSKIKNIYTSAGFTLIGDYKDDTKKDSYNTYLVFRRK